MFRSIIYEILHNIAKYCFPGPEIRGRANITMRGISFLEVLYTKYRIILRNIAFPDQKLGVGLILL